MNTTQDKTALVLIDLQQDYFLGGGWELDGADEAGRRAAHALAHARATGLPVLHVRHEGPVDSPLLAAGSAGARIQPLAAPQGDEPVIVKAQANAFWGTDLMQRLEAAGVGQLVLAGMMSNNCVAATAFAARERGFGLTVLADACAAMALSFGDRSLSGPEVHAVFMAELAFGFAEVVNVQDWLARSA